LILLLDLEDFGVPTNSRASFGSDLGENQDDGEYDDARPTEASTVFKEPPIQVLEASCCRSIALSRRLIQVVGTPSFDNAFGSKV
jgi:hypothetical protein